MRFKLAVDIRHPKVSSEPGFYEAQINGMEDPPCPVDIPRPKKLARSPQMAVAFALEELAKEFKKKASPKYE